MTEVPSKESSLDPTDCFVLDAGATVFVYHGPGCNVREKMKAMQVRGLGCSWRAAEVVRGAECCALPACRCSRCGC